MSLDDTGGVSLTNPAESASWGEAGGDGRIDADGRTMTGNDLDGRSLVQARVQAQVQAGVQGVAGMGLPIGDRLSDRWLLPVRRRCHKRPIFNLYSLHQYLVIGGHSGVLFEQLRVSRARTKVRGE